MYKVCIDTGGTFTDCVVLDKSGKFHEFKSPTTPSDFSEGVINSLSEAAEVFQISLRQFLEQVEYIVHGTTVATNAMVTRNVARTALITTKGFRDIIEMRRALKIETKSMYEAYIPPYESIVPRYLRFGVEEKTRYNGEIVKEINEQELKQVIEKLKQEKVEAIAICFLNSYINAANEKKAAEICAKSLDGAFVTCSSELLPKMGEYERESTCVINACLGPVVNKYMTSLENKLKANGFRGWLYIIQANQYVQTVSALSKKPAYVMGSGPAAAPAGAAFLGNVINEPNFIIGDMGGTTYDASLVKNGHVSLVAGKWLEEDRLGIKVVDVESIGAGGGSIGWIDSLGLLRVGPQSAAADPGPACYGRGGDKPTTTDAAVILGYISPDYFWGGKLKLDIQKAKAAMKTIADPLKLSIEDAAQAMFTTINSNMADDITEITTRKGYDVRDFALLACGGGGALCGTFIADHLDMTKIIVPRFSASFCAWSMFNLDVGRDYLRSYLCQATTADVNTINSLFEEMIDEALDEFKILGIGRDDIVIHKSADIRYCGQYHELEIDLPVEHITTKKIEEMIAHFHQKHKELFTFSLPWVQLEIRNLRLIAKVKSEKRQPQEITGGTEDPTSALKENRSCYFEGKHYDTPVYDGTKLKAGNILKGNAIIEETTSTTVIPNGFTCHVDKYGNYLISKVSN